MPTVTSINRKKRKKKERRKQRNKGGTGSKWVSIKAELDLIPPAFYEDKTGTDNYITLQEKKRIFQK